ncbi:hypothetical protein QZH56_35740 [Streptomyces olivoreticuli]|uniref:nuclear transport factor 2 family protein n=1 Tax=Streptomyces olivoreticuli TaxID=68246 RepID=UPI002657C454|nr:nuclear transport factor 2 family protein [Streptomyces olivoreticuli]WKK27739.1 hypothetical protein QZH56_35740 [Streptomyces olivoreticuli]
MVALFTDDARMEYPYAPEADFPAFPKVIEGKDRIRTYYHDAAQYIGEYRYLDWKEWGCHRLEGTDTYFFAYSARGSVRATGTDYRQDLFLFARMRGEKVSFYREFWDPYVALSTFGLIAVVPPL